jgi:hypothetical protein
MISESEYRSATRYTTSKTLSSKAALENSTAGTSNADYATRFAAREATRLVLSSAADTIFIAFQS